MERFEVVLPEVLHRLAILGNRAPVKPGFKLLEFHPQSNEDLVRALGQISNEVPQIRTLAQEYGKRLLGIDTTDAIPTPEAGPIPM